MYTPYPAQYSSATAVQCYYCAHTQMSLLATRVQLRAFVEGARIRLAAVENAKAYAIRFQLRNGLQRQLDMLRYLQVGQLKRQIWSSFSPTAAAGFHAIRQQQQASLAG